MPSQKRAHKCSTCESKSTSCMEKGCKDKFYGVQRMRNHMHMKHSFAFSGEIKTFQSMDEFFTWKREHEKQEKVSFVRRFGIRKKSEKQIVSYFCHCGGLYESQSEGKRRVRPSCKLGFSCTAGMTVTIDNSSGNVSVQYCKTHYSHVTDSKFLGRKEDPAKTLNTLDTEISDLLTSIGIQVKECTSPSTLLEVAKILRTAIELLRQKE